jgi:hypothetical protein
MLNNLENFWEEIKYKVGFYYHRFICGFKGCEIRLESGWNMPDDWSRPSYCTRCGACEDTYKFMDTDFDIIYEEDTFFGIIKLIKEGRFKWN